MQQPLDSTFQLILGICILYGMLEELWIATQCGNAVIYIIGRQPKYYFVYVGWTPVRTLDDVFLINPHILDHTLYAVDGFHIGGKCWDVLINIDSNLSP